MRDQDLSSIGLKQDLQDLSEKWSRKIADLIKAEANKIVSEEFFVLLNRWDIDTYSRFTSGVYNFTLYELSLIANTLKIDVFGNNDLSMKNYLFTIPLGAKAIISNPNKEQLADAILEKKQIFHNGIELMLLKWLPSNIRPMVSFCKLGDTGEKYNVFMSDDGKFPGIHIIVPNRF